MPDVLGDVVPDVGARVWKSAKAMGFAAEALEFEHVCVTKSGESGKDCKSVAAQKDKREWNLWYTFRNLQTFHIQPVANSYSPMPMNPAPCGSLFNPFNHSFVFMRHPSRKKDHHHQSQLHPRRPSSLKKKKKKKKKEETSDLYMIPNSIQWRYWKLIPCKKKTYNEGERGIRLGSVLVVNNNHNGAALHCVCYLRFTHEPVGKDTKIWCWKAQVWTLQLPKGNL